VGRLVLVRPLVGRHAALSGRVVVRAGRRREREVLLHAHLGQYVHDPLQRLLARGRLEPQVEQSLVGSAHFGLQPPRQLGARVIAGVLVGVEDLERDLMSGH
jgi:hypothetical protein